MMRKNEKSMEESLLRVTCAFSEKQAKSATFAAIQCRACLSRHFAWYRKKPFEAFVNKRRGKMNTEEIK